MYSRDWFSKVLVVLGFGTSKNIDPVVSTSYPLTKAFPGEIWYKASSSEGVSPEYVNWPSLNIPRFPFLLLRDSFTETSNGVTT